MTLDWQEREMLRQFALRLQREHAAQRPDRDGNMRIRHTDLRKAFTLLLDSAAALDDAARETTTRSTR